MALASHFIILHTMVIMVMAPGAVEAVVEREDTKTSSLLKDKELKLVMPNLINQKKEITAIKDAIIQVLSGEKP
jgi:hypothetical protein